MNNPLAAISAITSVTLPDVPPPPQAPASMSAGHVSFSQLFFDGVDKVSQQATAADSLAKAFVVDDSIAPHRVMYALEQSQLSLQIMMQVRNHLVEGYQEIMRMQL